MIKIGYFFACLISISMACGGKKSNAKVEMHEIPNSSGQKQINPTTTSAENDLSGKKFCVAFYNVENLYDIENDDKINDEDFLPDGKQKWTKERYEKKLKDLAKVIQEIGDKDGPEILGVCEIENKKVLEDLTSQADLKKHDYGIAHFDSPDKRGIDVALLYKKAFFELIKTEKFEVILPGDKPTRDVLLVSGKTKGKEINFIVNHFPSRREGEEESEPNRLAAGKVTRQIIDKLLAENPNANIIVMGDYNDEPTNNSIVEEIRANNQPNFEKGELLNLFYDIGQSKRGSYSYKGAWNMLDQMMISKALKTKLSGIKHIKSDIYAPEWLKETNPKYKGNPFRTYAGPNYLGGFSDHFAIYSIFE
jgi:predicted extracellular nuclease